MNLTQEDITAIKKLLDRDPSTVEKYIFDTMWSEHCSYKSSKKTLKKYLPVEGSEVALGIGEDSGIVHFTEHDGKKYCIAVSHESHNHPSQVLPVEGAATGVGGVVRDVYCMGADVVGTLDSLHFGIDKDNPIVEEIAEEVVQGVCGYANPLGVPVLGGETLFHPSYNDNCLVNVAALGLVEEDKIIHSYVPQCAKDTPYDVILFGKSTDATGFGGASFASATLDAEDEAANLGAVQVHDPFLKRVMVEAIKYLLKIVDEQKVSIGFKDLGAGGISCVTSEIAAHGGFGVRLDLDKVNVASKSLPPEVIACSETQERFCIVVPREFTPTVLDVFNNKFELPALYHNSGAVVVGEVIEEPVYRVFYRGEKVCELPVTAITTEVQAERTAGTREIIRTVENDNTPKNVVDLEGVCKRLLASENCCSKRYVYRFFDNAVRGDTILYPGEADAVVITPVEGSSTGLTVSMDSNLYGNVDPYVSGAAAVAESVRNIIAVGGRPMALTDCLNYGNPEKPGPFFDFEEGVKGIADAANSLSFIPGEPIPIISGNVSFYNESKQGASIIPSPVLVAVGKVDDYHKICTMQLKNEDEKLLLIGNQYPEFGGTLINGFISDLNEVAPQVRFDEEAKQNKAVNQLIKDQLISACHDISMGGLWLSICEMLFGERGLNKVGVELELAAESSVITSLFSENGSYIVSVSAENEAKIRAVLDDNKVDYSVLGKVVAGNRVKVNLGSDPVLDVDVTDLAKIWNHKNS
jgi:phosphoribosylformylglycinamidine synthase subunit PurL